MRTLVLILVLAVSLGMSGCNMYYADQATKRGVEAYDTGKQAQKHGDLAKAATYYREAKREFQVAVENEPTVSNRHLNLGRAYQALKEYDQAVREYDLAIRYFPGNAKAHWGKIYCLVNKGAPQKQITEAVNTAVTQVQLDPGRIYLTWAMGYYHTGQTSRMPEMLDKAAQASPRDAYVQATVGRYYQAIGQTGSAIKHLVIAYELDPNQPGVAYDLGVLGQKLPPR
ncbi:MAG: tetratricopeptide repeat protein [Actinobacteria bacterium]|nr:tetratricopeptide repeat protein [Actinomycetota bacterium]